MATMLKVSREYGKEEEKGEMKMTPEQIQNKLFSFHNAAHKYHLDTTSFEIHKALNKLYEGVGDFKDEILEKLMGYLDGKRIGKLKLEEVPEYSDSNVKKLVNDIKDFAYELYEWAGDNHYCDVENKAQELSGLAAQTAYMLTLK